MIDLNINNLSESISRSLYRDQFEVHLQRLMTIDFSAHRRVNEIPIIPISQKRYDGMEQTAFELSEYYEHREPLEVNWKDVRTSRDNLQNRFKELLGDEFKSELLRPLVNRSLDAYENSLIYQSMYPRTKIDPWQPTTRIIQSGLLFFVTDDKDQASEYVKGTKSDIDSRQRNIAVIVKGSKKKFGGLELDNRFAAQTELFIFLSEHARGSANRKPLIEIQRFLREKDFIYNNINDIQILITTPLKKTGFIGSNTHGFFYIETEDDLKEAFRFHYIKSKSIFQVMERYRQRQKEFEDLDLDSAIEEES